MTKPRLSVKKERISMTINEIDKQFNEKFCDEKGNWKGYWQEVDIYARDVKSFIHRIVKQTRKDDALIAEKKKRTVYRLDNFVDYQAKEWNDACDDIAKAIRENKLNK